MRTSLSLAVAVLILTVLPLAAIAQQDTGKGPGPAIQQGAEKQITPEQFTAMKSRILNMIEVRKAKLDEEKACVEAATTPAELRKCRPRNPMGPGSWRNGPGRQQPPPGQQQ